MKINTTQKTRSRPAWKPLNSALMLAIAVLLSCFSFTEALSQTVTVSGQVTDSQGGGLPGATVTQQGTNTGTVTDMNGEYSLAVTEGSTLVFSFVGYLTETVEIGNRSTIDVSLTEDIQSLQEVVVVGYGAQRKSDITGSIASVDEKSLREVPVANLSQALQGRAAGLEIVSTGSRPGDAGRIRIRGNRSLTAGNDPLLVVDGIPYGGTINDLNPDDITSVEVLKDASATAIYGARGSNGVIIISTRRGKPGKPQLTYNGYYGVNTVANEYDVFSGEEFANLRQISGYNARGNQGTFLTVEEQSLALGRETNWQDLMYGTGVMTNHELGVSGGTESTQYSLSGGYFNESTVLPGQDFTRYSLRATVDTEIGSRVKVGINTMNNLSVRNGESVSPLYPMVTLSPLTVPFDDAGNRIVQPTLGTDDYFNPLFLFDDNAWAQERRRIRTFNSLYGEVQIAEGFRYRLNVGLDFFQERYGDFLGSATPMRNGQLNTAQTQNAEQYSYTIENLLYYDKTINEKHRIGGTALFSVQEQTYQNSIFNFRDIPINYLQFYDMGQATDFISADGNYNSWSILSYMGRFNYSYDDRYVLTLTARADGSSRLAPGNQWQYYPAASAAWNISNEDFMGDNVVSDLKLRAGWGQVANTGVNPYQTQGLLGTERYNFGPQGAVGYYAVAAPNLNLGWEVTTTVNFGVDFGFFQNRITGSLELYEQNTNDLLMNQNLPPTSGTAFVLANVGATRNRGVEFNISTVNVESSTGFNWSTDFNIFFNRNEITALANPDQVRDIDNGWHVGHPIDAIFDFNKIGIWQADEADEAASYGFQVGQIKLEDINNDGQITGDDRSIIGAMQPDFQAGMTNRFSYKNFDFSVVAFARVGGTLVSTLHQPQSYVNMLSGRRSGIRVDYWTPDNPTNDHPRPDVGQENPLYGSTLGYFDASFLRIRSINLGYTLPNTWCERVGMGSVRVYLASQDPFIFFSPYMDAGGLDPEPTGTGGSSTPGLGNRLTIGLNTPRTTAFMGGVNIRF